MKKITKKDIIDAFKPFFHAPSMVTTSLGLYLLHLTERLPEGYNRVIILLGVSIWCLVSIAWWSITTKLNCIEESIQRRN